MSEKKRLTILDVLNSSRDFLEKRGVPSPRVEAEVLISHLLGCDRMGVYMNFERPLTDAEADSLREMVQRRGKREPLNYITGHREFWSLDFRVNSSVLIPRPETELLVEEGVKAMKNVDSPSILDVGTGSGAIAIALARELPSAKIWATDISSEALGVAQANSTTHGLTERITFIQCPGLGIAGISGVKFDLIVSNPPYIKTGEIEGLEPEVRDHEPRGALDGGRDGFDVIRMISSDARKKLKTGGFLLVEIGDGMWGEMEKILIDDWYVGVELKRDYAGLERVAKAVAG